MKQLLFGLVGLVGFGAMAQDVNGVKVEDFPDVIEITVTGRILSDQVNVTVDAGQRTHFITFTGRKNYALTHEGSNNRVEFDNKADVLNFFGDHGYHVKQKAGFTLFPRGESFLVKLITLNFGNLSKGLNYTLVKKKVKTEEEIKAYKEKKAAAIAKQQKALAHDISAGLDKVIAKHHEKLRQEQKAQEAKWIENKKLSDAEKAKVIEKQRKQLANNIVKGFDIVLEKHFAEKDKM